MLEEFLISDLNLVNDDFLLHKFQEPICVSRGVDGRDQVGVSVQHEDLEVWLHLFAEVEGLEVVNDSNMVNEQTVSTDEHVSRTLEIADQL